MRKSFLLLSIIIFQSSAFADFTTNKNANDFIFIDGKIEIKTDGIDIIHSKHRDVFVKHTDIVRNNPVEPKILLQRKIFKIRVNEINNVVNLTGGSK